MLDYIHFRPPKVAILSCIFWGAPGKRKLSDPVKHLNLLGQLTTAHSSVTSLPHPESKRTPIQPRPRSPIDAPKIPPRYPQDPPRSPMISHRSTQRSLHPQHRSILSLNPSDSCTSGPLGTCTSGSQTLLPQTVIHRPNRKGPSTQPKNA